MYEIKAMSQSDAEEIVTWTYDEPYSFFNMENDPEDLAELLSPESRENRYFSVYKKADLIGFFEYEKRGKVIDIALGMKPELTGKKQGFDFLKAGLAFAKERFAPSQITLSVAPFNKRAIKVYERAGFIEQDRIIHRSNGREYGFIKMGLEVSSGRNRALKTDRS